jgi:hypothetical protein
MIRDSLPPSGSLKQGVGPRGWDPRMPNLCAAPNRPVRSSLNRSLFVIDSREQALAMLTASLEILLIPG